MLLFIEKKFQNLGTFLDNTIFKKSAFYTFFCKFFDSTSRITNFLLFNKIGYFLFLFSIGLFIHHYFNFINTFLLNIKLFGFSKIFYNLSMMPLGFQFGVFFLFFFIK